MNTYHASTSVGSHGEAALACATERLVRWDFQVVDRSPGRVVLHGPGLRSTREARARGASRVTLLLVGETLELSAELGAADRMARFCRVFPISLCLTLGAILGTTFLFVFPFQLALVGYGAGLVTAAPWMALGPLMGEQVYQESRKGLESVLRAAREAAEAQR